MGLRDRLDAKRAEEQAAEPIANKVAAPAVLSLKERLAAAKGHVADINAAQELKPIVKPTVMQGLVQDTLGKESINSPIQAKASEERLAAAKSGVTRLEQQTINAHAQQVINDKAQQVINAQANETLDSAYFKCEPEYSIRESGEVVAPDPSTEAPSCTIDCNICEELSTCGHIGRTSFEAKPECLPSKESFNERMVRIKAEQAAILSYADPDVEELQEDAAASADIVEQLNNKIKELEATLTQEKELRAEHISRLREQDAQLTKLEERFKNANI